MSSSPPETFTVRPLALADAERAAEVIAALEETCGSRPMSGPAQVRMWWERVDLGTDSWVVEEDGETLALAWLERGGDVPEAIVSVHPSHTGRGFGSGLLDRAEARARESGANRMRSVSFARDAGGCALLEARGFREIRRFYGMEVELDASLPAAQWPPGIHVERFRREDARAFFDALEEAFADEWGRRSMSFEEWLRLRVDSPDADHSMWFLAWDGDEVAAVIRNDGDRQDAGWVGALGVRRAWRRRGLGLALLLHTFAEFRRRGKERVGLGVDSENPTGATRLYERAGMHVALEDVIFERALV